MSQIEQTQSLIADLVLECRDRENMLRALVQGAADGSIDWHKLNVIRNAVGTILNAADSIIPKHEGIPPDPTDTFKAALAHRANRLAKLIKLDAPVRVIVQQCELIFKGACCLDPDAVGSMLARRIAREGRTNHGYCSSPDCPNPLSGSREAPMCESCLGEILDEDDHYIDPHTLEP